MISKLQAGLYCRISQEDEVRHGNSASIETQKKKLSDFAAQSSISVYSSYCDDGFSGTTFDRPAFRQLIADIESKKVNCVIVKDLSRLGREYIQSGNLLENFFPKHNTRFIALDDNIDRDPQNPTLESNMMIPFFNLMNEFYPSDISKKTRSALRTKAIHGEYIASIAPYGYRKSPENRHQLIVDESCSEWVPFIFNKFIEGWSLTKIARELHKIKVPSPSDMRCHTHTCSWTSQTIKSILKNEIYCGKTVFGRRTNISYKNKTIIHVPREKWIVVENMHKALVSESQMKEAMTLLQVCKRECISTSTHPFLGKLYCPDCNEPLNFCREPRKSNPDEGYFVCRTNKRYGISECSRHYVRLSVLTEAVSNELIRLYSLASSDRIRLYSLILSQKELLSQRIRYCVETRLEESKCRLGEIEKIFLKLYSDMALKKISQKNYDMIANQLSEEQGTVEKQFWEDTQFVSTVRTETLGIDSFIDKLLACGQELHNPTRKTFHCLIEKILVENKSIEQGVEIQNIRIFYCDIGFIAPINILP
ncbi:MAG: recombinase family protein [Angelakisella sp.]